MSNEKRSHRDGSGVSRRQFVTLGGAAAAAGTLTMCSKEVPEVQVDEAPVAAIKRFRTLGRTGFEVSDISLGGRANDENVVRYAYDKGMNYFDTAETYGNGEAERRIGKAMQFMDRSKIFITTKMVLEDEDTEQSILERYGKCLERLQTDYADAFFIHSVQHATLLDHPGYHAAVAKLKADGRVKHAGVSCHGPQEEGEDSMEKILVAAAEDGRFDLMLLSYNFMNEEEAHKVLAACKANNVGTTAMKTAPGAVEIDPFDPENPSKEFADYIESQVAEGVTREEVVARIEGWIAQQEQEFEKTLPFREKHGLTSKEETRKAAVKWVLSNPDMHTVCLGLDDFEAIDAYVPLSGTSLTVAQRELLEDYRLAYNGLYCRHGCTSCMPACPHSLPVSRVMRYSYYFAGQQREKYAMTKYAGLAGRDATLCFSCSAPCTGACPHGANVQLNLIKAHSLLAMA